MRAVTFLRESGSRCSGQVDLSGLEPSGEGLGDLPGGVSASSPRSRSRIALLVVLARQCTHFWFWKRSPQSSTDPVLNFVLRDGGGTRPHVHTPTRQGNRSPGRWPDWNALFRKLSAAKNNPLGQLGVFLLQHKSPETSRSATGVLQGEGRSFRAKSSPDHPKSKEEQHHSF